MARRAGIEAGLAGSEEVRAVRSWAIASGNFVEAGSLNARLNQSLTVRLPAATERGPTSMPRSGVPFAADRDGITSGPNGVSNRSACGRLYWPSRSARQRLVRWQLGVRLNTLLPGMPPGTLLANLLGGFLIGLAIAYFSQAPGIPGEWRLFLITGAAVG